MRGRRAALWYVGGLAVGVALLRASPAAAQGVEVDESRRADASAEPATLEAPASEAPINEMLSAETPTSEAPTSEVPTSEVPTSEVPTSETPAAEAAGPEAEPASGPSRAVSRADVRRAVASLASAWWFWVALGLVAVGIALAIVVDVTTDDPATSTDAGLVVVRY